MKVFPILRIIAWMIGIFASIFHRQAFADYFDGRGRSEAPRFEVYGEGGATDDLPLKSTKVDATIAGVIAQVTVTQIYRNQGKGPIEAVYVFPASTSVAVHGLTMTIGDREIVAKVKEKSDARAEYVLAKQVGKSASLLAQRRPNVFQMNVANILPGDEIKVTLSYTEMLMPTERMYEFVAPTVVGPRYSRGKVGDARSESWTKNPYLNEGEDSQSDFDIKVRIEGGMPIRDISSISHDVRVDFESATSARVGLSRAGASNSNRDFILKYRLAGEALQTGLLLHEGDGEKFFLALLEPPYRPKQEEIPGRDFVFVVDVSGSMMGFPIEVTKSLIKNLVGNLRPTDTFNILTFAGGSDLLSAVPLPATDENIDRGVRFVEAVNGGGGTNLLPALKKTYEMALPEGRSRSIVIVTDGFVDVETEAFDIVSKNLDKGNVFAFGIGSSVNRYLIEGLAHIGLGEPFVVTTKEESAKVSSRFQSYVTSPLLTQAKIHFDGFDAYDVIPQSIPDVLSNRPIAVFGKWRGKRQGAIRLTGSTGKGRYEKWLPVTDANPLKSNEAIKYLWARRRMRDLGDYDKLYATDARKKEIIDLGLSYNLLSDFTSFIAVDRIARNQASEVLQTITQPLPLPQGVSEASLGGEISTSPEPETWALLLVAMTLVPVILGMRSRFLGGELR